MTRYVISREIGETTQALQARARGAVQWLACHGGGTVLVPEIQRFEDCFGRAREAYESLMLRSHVTFERYPRRCRSRVGLPARYGSVLLVYPSRDEVEAAESWGISGDAVMVEWDPDVTVWWRERHEVPGLGAP